MKHQMMQSTIAVRGVARRYPLASSARPPTNAPAAFAVSSVGERGADVGLGQFRIVGDDLGMRHAGRKPTENIRDSDAHAADAGASAALARLLGDDVAIIGGHGSNIARRARPGEPPATRNPAPKGGYARANSVDTRAPKPVPINEIRGKKRG